MSAEGKALAAQLRASREFRVEIEQGKFITLRRPRSGDLEDFIQVIDGKTNLVCEPRHLVQYAVGWTGVLQTDIFPPGVGASDPAPWDLELFSEVIYDKPTWASKCSKEMIDRIEAHYKATRAEQGNSEPSSA